MILLADDDDSFCVLLPHVARKISSQVCFSFVADGVETVDYLRGNGKFSNRDDYPFPQALLLDLKMPRMGGFEVLKWKESHREFDRLPVVVWSSSDLAEDKTKAMSLGADRFFCKPMEFDGLTEIIRCLEGYCRDYQQTRV